MVKKAAFAFILVAFHFITYASEKNLQLYAAILNQKLLAPNYQSAADFLQAYPKLKDRFKNCLLVKPKAVIEKSRSLLRKISELELPVDQMNAVTMIKNMCFLAVTKKHLKRNLTEANDLYIHPSPEYLTLPLQINVRRDILAFRHARYYLHFKDLDPMGRHGGFKQFSRSIEVKSEELVANLVSKTEKYGQITNVLNELEILSAFHDSKLHLRYYNSSMYADQEQKLQIAFQTPLYSHDLSTYPVAEKPLDEILAIAQTMAEALVAMHNKKFVHRDVKPHNFLINEQAQSLDIVLADFGLSLHFIGPLHPSFVPGTRGYRDPALLMKVATKQAIFFEDLCAADVFSLGMSLFRMFANDMEIFENNRELNNIERNKSMSNKERLTQMSHELTAYQALYQKQVSLLKEHSLHDLFSKTIYRMIHPDIHDRITLKDAIKEIAHLRQQYKKHENP